MAAPSPAAAVFRAAALPVLPALLPIRAAVHARPLLLRLLRPLRPTPAAAPPAVAAALRAVAAVLRAAAAAHRAATAAEVAVAEVTAAQAAVPALPAVATVAAVEAEDSFLRKKDI